MIIVAKQYVNEANSLIQSKSYLEYFSYFKRLKLTQIARTFQKAGDIYEAIGYLKDAAENYTLSATYYIEINNNSLSAINHEKAGSCYKKIKEYNKSNISYMMVLEQHFEHNLTINCYNSIAENYFDMGNITESIKWFEKCIQSNIKIGHDDLNFVFYEKLGIIYTNFLKHYSIAVTIYDKLVNNSVYQHIYCFIGVLLRILANEDILYAKKYMESLDKSFLESKYADFLENIFILRGKNNSLLIQQQTYFEEYIPELKNINVQMLLNTVFAPVI